VASTCHSSIRNHSEFSRIPSELRFKPSGLRGTLRSVWKRMSSRGRRRSGRRVSGRRVNGRRVNGRRVNGRRVNGRRVNGRRVNGRRVNGRRGFDRPDLFFHVLLPTQLFRSNCPIVPVQLSSTPRRTMLISQSGELKFVPLFGELPRSGWCRPFSSVVACRGRLAMLDSRALRPTKVVPLLR
jgi:hypothetical protein